MSDNNTVSIGKVADVKEAGDSIGSIIDSIKGTLGGIDRAAAAAVVAKTTYSQDLDMLLAQVKDIRHGVHKNVRQTEAVLATLDKVAWQNRVSGDFAQNLSMHIRDADDLTEQCRSVESRLVTASALVQSDLKAVSDSMETYAKEADPALVKKLEAHVTFLNQAAGEYEDLANQGTGGPSGALTGAAVGVAVGAAAAGPVGAIVGGALGAATGLAAHEAGEALAGEAAKGVRP